jgi:hypothetical protein
MQYRKYTDGKTRSECLASHTMPLLENSPTLKKATQTTIEIYPETTLAITITQAITHPHKAVIFLEEYTIEDEILCAIVKETKFSTINPIPLDGGHFIVPLSKSTSCDLQKIEIRLSKEIDPTVEKSDTTEPKK